MGVGWREEIAEMWSGRLNSKLQQAINCAGVFSIEKLFVSCAYDCNHDEDVLLLLRTRHNITKRVMQCSVVFTLSNCNCFKMPLKFYRLTAHVKWKHIWGVLSTI